MKTALLAIAYLILSPMAGGLIATAMIFGMHWISGESSDPSSGQPWLMVGGMLFLPLGLVVGLIVGVVKSAKIAYAAWSGK